MSKKDSISSLANVEVLKLAEPQSPGVALIEEALRLASGSRPVLFDQVRGDVWLIHAMRDAVEALDGPFDYEVDSLQRRLLSELDESGPERKVWDQFESAKQVRHRGLQDLAARALTGQPYSPDLQQRLGGSAALKMAMLAPGLPDVAKGAKEILEREGATDLEGEDCIDAREVALVRLATAFPEQLLPSAGFRQMMDLALLGGRGRELIKELATAFKNAGRARKTLGIDELEVAMTINFTNPDFPLWLATKEALAAMLHHQFGLEDVTEEGVKKFRSRKLKTPSPYPIHGYRVYKDGRHEFEVEEGLEIVLL